MLHTGLAYDIVSRQRNAMLAQAVTTARVRAARRALRGCRGGSAPTLMSRIRIPLRLRAA